jgi:hypothetical protein
VSLEAARPRRRIIGELADGAPPPLGSEDHLISGAARRTVPVPLS